jgi:hypothetical protein
METGHVGRQLTVTSTNFADPFAIKPDGPDGTNDLDGRIVSPVVPVEGFQHTIFVCTVPEHAVGEGITLW